MESVVGIGCAAGPVLGSVTYELMGFAWTFLLFGIIMSPTSILLFFFLQNPKEVVAKRFDPVAPEEENEEERKL